MNRGRSWAVVQSSWKQASANPMGDMRKGLLCTGLSSHQSFPACGLLWEGCDLVQELSSGEAIPQGLAGGEMKTSFLKWTQGARHRITISVKRETYHLPRITYVGDERIKSGIMHTCTSKYKVEM